MVHVMTDTDTTTEPTTTLATYALVQPSDDYSFKAPNDQVATLLACFLGEGVGWNRTDPETDETATFMNLFLNEEAFAKKMGRTMPEVLDDTDFLAQVADAMLTVEIQPDKRERLGVDPELWHNEQRTSMNDFRAAAQDWNKRLGGMIEKIKAKQAETADGDA